MSEPTPGTIVAGKYKIKKRLGRGGFGAVYEAEHVEIGRRVALKTIDRTHSANVEQVTRFRREARAAGSVESEHIVHVFDIGEDPDVGLYMVMELLAGEDLSTKLDRVGRLSVEHAVDFAHQAARGLGKAHAAGVIHRDLKPANIFLTSREEATRATVKVVDFGVSKLAPNARVAGDDEAITRAGVTMGTPQYMAPEQVRGGVIDHRVDVWALGAVLYEMLAGTAAYPLLETYEQTFMSIAMGRPKPLAELAPWVPAPLVDVVERAMQHELSARFHDCEAFADALVTAMPSVFPDSARRRRPKLEPPPPPPSSPRENSAISVAVPLSPSMRKRRRRLRIVAFSALAVASAIALIAIGSRLRPPTPSESNVAAPPQATGTPLPTVTPSTTTKPSVTVVMAKVSASTPNPSAQPSAPTTALKTAPIVAVPKQLPPPEPTQFGAAGVSSSY